MSQGDMIGPVLSYVYVFGLLFAVEAIGKRRGWAPEFTRKIVHSVPLLYGLALYLASSMLASMLLASMLLGGQA